LAVAPGIPIWYVSQFTRLFWINSISPRRQHNSNADDAIVEQRSDELVLRCVQLLQCRVEQLLLLVSGKPSIARRFGLLVHPNAESVKRRLPEQRQCLRHSPVHRRAERFERSMNRRQLDALGVRRFM
jgi:hypothetical protein